MKIETIRTFLPSKDFAISKQFYLDLGFQIQWESKDLIIFGEGDHAFFLQDYYVKEWAENLMMQLYVEDLDALYEKALPLIASYEGTKIKPIFSADYGRTFHLIGPSGELWHMTETQHKNEDPQQLICEDN